jgi:predicted ATPase
MPVRIATTLEDRFPEIVVVQPTLLAQHCAEAGLAEKAVGYWLNAGQQALDRSAMTEAVAQLRKGLTCWLVCRMGRGAGNRNWICWSRSHRR